MHSKVRIAGVHKCLNAVEGNACINAERNAHMHKSLKAVVGNICINA